MHLHVDVALEAQQQVRVVRDHVLVRVQVAILLRRVAGWTHARRAAPVLGIPILSRLRGLAECFGELEPAPAGVPPNTIGDCW
jgi:hypothetical protein